ncbi:concanavalin A-like lectin/glucanase [Anaeromyces robustus]|uniref:endo-1,4-beta-xylanase n=1 Tax=Anaeromyces robustus TaxID=1754192 RepID=A0A1Y1VR47_9FUNG|nr:concanavalin A-like lectin/glucanase [Anaeromyces robustus]|eukprot:ORX63758.1 concanavalin A-like lectin/glucanase [Anaeromyces robustus]
MKFSQVIPILISLTTTTTTLAQSFCSSANHSGQSVKETSNKVGNIGGVGYEIWSDSGNNSATFYSDGSFSCSFQNAKDYLCRSGLSFDSTQTHSQIGHMFADFKLVKQNIQNVDYSYVGIYGWTRNPLVEYYIVDNWLSQGRPGDWVGNQKHGDFTIDGAQYTVYENTRTGPSIDGDTTFKQYFSIRQQARDCGTIDITAHFQQWEKLGMQMGKMHEAKVLGEAGSNGAGTSGTADFPYAKVYIGEGNGGGGGAAAPAGGDGGATNAPIGDVGGGAPTTNSAPEGGNGQVQPPQNNNGGGWDNGGGNMNNGGGWDWNNNNNNNNGGGFNWGGNNGGNGGGFDWNNNNDGNGGGFDWNSNNGGNGGGFDWNNNGGNGGNGGAWNWAAPNNNNNNNNGGWNWAANNGGNNGGGWDWNNNNNNNNNGGDWNWGGNGGGPKFFTNNDAITNNAVSNNNEATQESGNTNNNKPKQCAPIWGQCGGQGFNGPTCCSEGACVSINEFYSQCQE